MKIEQEHRTKIYNTIKVCYKTVVNDEFDFRSKAQLEKLGLSNPRAERTRVKQIFEKFCTKLDRHELEDFDYVYDLFLKYVFMSTKKWALWEKRSRLNYIGFLDNTENIAIFLAGEVNKTSQNNLSIGGTKTNDEWDL